MIDINNNTKSRCIFNADNDYSRVKKVMKNYRFRKQRITNEDYNFAVGAAPKVIKLYSKLASYNSTTVRIRGNDEVSFAR